MRSESRRRLLLLASGTLLLGFLWIGPLPELARLSFSSHMALHMGVVAVAAPLLTAGIAGSRLDPVPLVPTFFAPIPLSLVELVVVWSWHAPALHHAARHEWKVMAVEQTMFLAAGLLVWLSAFGGKAPQLAERRGAGIVALLLTSMHMTLLGALLALTPRPLFAHASGAVALGDQHMGGAIMLLVGGISYLGGGLWLTRRLLEERRFIGGRA